MKDWREGDKITESGTANKTEGGNYRKRNNNSFFMMVEPWRDESPDLEKDDWAG